MVDGSSTPTVKQYMPPSIGSPPALVGPDQQENQTGEREDQARDADDSVAHAYSSNWAMNSSIALRVTRRQLLVPRRLGGRNVVRVPLFAAMSSA